MISIEPHVDGALLPVRARAAARVAAIRGVQDGALKVFVTQAPEKGKANRELIRFLSKTIGKQVRISLCTPQKGEWT